MSSIVVFGPPGTGKTTLLSTLCKVGYIPWIYDADKKIRSMEHLQPLVKEGKIRVYEPQSKLNSGSLKTRILLGAKAKILQQPQGYLELVDWVTALQEEPPEDHAVVVPCIDSLTRVLEHLTRMILHIQQTPKMGFDEYKFLLSNLEEFFDSFFSLQNSPGQDEEGKDLPPLYPHAVMTAHTQTEKDELLGKIKILPRIDGSMRDKIGSYVSEMYYTGVEARGDDVEYYVQTKPIGMVDQARSSMEGVETYMPSDFSAIFGEGKGAK